MTEKRRVSYKKILKKLSGQQHKPIEYTIDQVAKFRLINIDGLIEAISKLAKSKTIILKKTNKGFSFKLRDKNQQK